MKNKNKIWLVTLTMLWLASYSARAMGINPVNWSTSMVKGQNDTMIILFKAVTSNGWQVFTKDKTDASGEESIQISISPSPLFRVIGKPFVPKSILEGNVKDPKSKTQEKDNETILAQKIVAYTEHFHISSTIVYSSLGPGNQVNHHKTSIKFSYNQEKTSASMHDLLQIFWIGFIAGFLTLVTPCILFMVPLTASYFCINSGSPKSTQVSTFVIILYLFQCLVVMVSMSTSSYHSNVFSGAVSLLISLVLITLGLSFIGAFSIDLPYGWLSTPNYRLERKGIIALSSTSIILTLVSYSFTGPTLACYVENASLSRHLIGPASGIAGFALALSTPLWFIIVYPKFMSLLEKAGVWQHKNKMVLGYFEIMLGILFLFKFDQYINLGIMHAELFIGLIILVLAIMVIHTLKLWNIMKPHYKDSISWIRVFMVTLVLGTISYLIPGLWGSRSSLISAMTMPHSCQGHKKGSDTTSSYCLKTNGVTENINQGNILK